MTNYTTKKQRSKYIPTYETCTPIHAIAKYTKYVDFTRVACLTKALSFVLHFISRLWCYYLFDLYCTAKVHKWEGFETEINGRLPLFERSMGRDVNRNTAISHSPVSGVW